VKASIVALGVIPRENVPTKYGAKTFFTVTVQSPEDKVAWGTGGSKKLADVIEGKLGQLIEVEYEEVERKGWLNRKITSVDGVGSGGFGGTDFTPLLEELRKHRAVLEQIAASVGAGSAKALSHLAVPTTAPESTEEPRLPASAPAPTTPPPADWEALPVEIRDALGATNLRSNTLKLALLRGFLGDMGLEAVPHVSTDEFLALMDRIAAEAGRTRATSFTNRGTE
jgi:hypothetical protein